MRKLITIGYFLLFVLRCFCQNPTSDQNIDLMKDDIEGFLPPLEVLIDSAINNNPYVRFRDLQIDVNEHKLKSDRNQWLRNIGVHTDVNYGTYSNFTTNEAQGQGASNIVNTNTQGYYQMGAYLKFPVYDFYNRKNQIGLAKAEIEQAKSFALVQRKEVRETVIRQYNDVVVKQRLLRIKSKYAETSLVNMEMTEKEFINGVINVTEYSRISEIVSRAQAEYEAAKMDLKTSYMILQETTGMHFHLSFKTKN